MDKATASRSSSDDRAAAGSKPLIAIHAELLVSSYGKTRALQIAEVNSTVEGKDSYWLLVLQAVREAPDTESTDDAVRGYR
jgi:hypothetical protein